jgi:hypothetical protein
LCGKTGQSRYRRQALFNKISAIQDLSFHEKPPLSDNPVMTSLLYKKS